MGDKYYKWGWRSFLGLILILFLGTNESFAQAREANNNTSNQQSTTKKGFDPSRLVFGGSLGGQFGDITYFEITPRVGYLIRDNWIAGIGAKYAYYEENTRFVNFNTSMYGGGVYTQYYFLRYFVAHAEYELLNLDDFRTDERTNIHSIFVGGGISSRLGNSRSFFNALLLYNLNETYNSPYANPYLQIGVGFGL